MSLDLNTVISSLLGSLIGMIGAITVAILYIRNQNKSEKKRRLHERIQETYFEEGILPMEAALSEYGTSTVFAVADVRTWTARCLKFREEDVKSLEAEMDKISKRPAIRDLTDHTFSLAIKWFPMLQRFGMPLYNSMKRTLQLYSSILSDLLTIENIKRQIDGSSVDEFIRSSAVVAEILQRMSIYLERRFENLKDYVWQKEYKNYLDFLDMVKEQKYQVFLSDLEQYLKYMSDWMDALKSKESEDRKRTSLALSKWLSENIDHNPLE